MCMKIQQSDEKSKYWRSKIRLCCTTVHACKEKTNLVNEGSEAVVEGLDLLFLLVADNLDVGIDF